MKTFALLLLLGFFAPFLSASSDEQNHPNVLKDELASSQFVFIGRLEVTKYRFVNAKLEVVEDKDQVMWKGYLKNRYEAELPDRIQKWSTVKVSRMILGSKDLVGPFLSETWIEPSLVGCPHHATAVSGEERIWFLVIGEDFRKPFLRSMPMKHLEAVEAYLKILSSSE